MFLLNIMSITLGTGVCKLMNILYEGLRAKKGVYQFLADFHFCRLELIFHRLACFDMKRIVPQLSRPVWASFSRNNVRKKTQFSFGDLFFQRKQKIPFVSLTFIIIHQTHYEKSDWSRSFNQFTIARELDMTNAISAADIAFIMSNLTSAWLLSPLECSPQKQNS